MPCSHPSPCMALTGGCCSKQMQTAQAVLLRAALEGSDKEERG